MKIISQKKMRSHSLILTAFLILGMRYSALAQKPCRDPFWPIGYIPPVPESEKPVEKPEPVKVAPEPPTPEPITEKEWQVARKLLEISGYALSEKTSDDNAEGMSLVIINRKHYKTDDLVKIKHNDILFVWKVGTIGNNTVKLIPESATRNPTLPENTRKLKKSKKN